MKNMYRACCILMTLFFTVYLTVCVDKKPAGSSTEDESAFGIDGTWTAVTLQLVSGDSVLREMSWQADSSTWYMELDGSAVMMHLLITEGAREQAFLYAGTYAGDSVTFENGSYTISRDGSDLRLTSVDSSDGERSSYVFNRYDGTVPPGYWPAYSAIGDDAYEPDDTRDQATLLEYAGGSQFHTMPDGDVDFFKIQLQAGVLYQLSFGDSIDQFEFTYYDADGNSLYPSREGIYRYNTFITVTVEQDRDLYIEVSNYSGEGVYAAALTAFEDDAYEVDDTLETATSLASGCEQVHLIRPGNSDWVRLDLQPGYYYYLTYETDRSFYSGNIHYSYRKEPEPDKADSYDEIFNVYYPSLVSDYTCGISVSEAATLYFTIINLGSSVFRYSVSLKSIESVRLPYAGNRYYLSAMYFYHSNMTTDSVYNAFSEDETYNWFEFGDADMKWYSSRRFAYSDGTDRLIPLPSGMYLLENRYSSDTVSIIPSGSNLIITEKSDNYERSRTLSPYSGELPPSVWETGPPVPDDRVVLTIGPAESLYVGAYDEVWHSFTAPVDGYVYILADMPDMIEMFLFSESNGFLVQETYASYETAAGVSYYMLNMEAGSTVYMAVQGINYAKGSYTVEITRMEP